MMFMYPESFVIKAKAIYPDWQDLHYYLNKNDKIVGRMLEQSRGMSLDEDMIISLFRNNKTEKILEAAKRAQAKRNIYNEWVALVDAVADQHGYQDE
jgi:hypothetical protein